MPIYQRGDVCIRYEEAGSGFPLLVTPGGGLNSRVINWPTAVFNAMEVFKNDFRCITMDQRNANNGESTGPVPVDDPWDAFADDQLGLMDHLDGKPAFDVSMDDAGWEALRLGALATSLMDGLSVWLRETRRPETEQSPGILRHETDRARRLIDLWETEIDCPTMQGRLNLAQIVLICALGLQARIRDFRWREGHPRLREWFDRSAARPSIAATAPPEAR